MTTKFNPIPVTQQHLLSLVHGLERYSKNLLMLLLLSTSYSCSEFLEIESPKTRITTETVFENDDTALAATLGMYDLLARISSFGASGAPESVSTLTGFLSDEFINYSPLNAEFVENDVSQTNAFVLSLWSSAYSAIYSANAVIEGVESSKGMTIEKRKQFEGEAKFVRAFCHFYLANLFGDVPLVTSTDYRANAVLSRTKYQIVYAHIIQDLKDAQQLLSIEYPSAERGRPNKACATAMLARVHLYVEDWTNAELESSKVIDDPSFSVEEDLINVFLKDSREAIWQLVSTGDYYDSYEGLYFIVEYAPENQSLTNQLIESFAAGDKRLEKWIGSYEEENTFYYFPYKYKVQYNDGDHIEHSIVLRLAEQYLIRAEARAKLNKLTGTTGTESDINVIRLRAGLELSTAQSQTEWLSAIEQERKVELFSEWGHRWFDLKRTNRSNQVLSPLKPSWQVEDMILPLPENEMKNNPALTPQNPGY